MKRVTTVVTFFFLMLSGAAFAADRPTTIDAFLDSGGRTRVIAHRGFSGRAPENTLAAIQEAIAIGADMAEIDVTLSSDEKIVVIHDETLQRTTNGTGKVAQHSFADLKKLDAGSWFDPQFTGEPIPTLDQVLDAVEGKILLNIEIKSEAVERGIAAMVVETVRQHEMINQVIISSFSPEALERVRSLAPDFVTAVLYNKDFHRDQDAVDIVQDLGASAFNIKRARLTRKMRKRCRENGIPIGIYTVNTPRHMRRMIKKGITAIFTDHPDVLIEVRQKLKQ